MAASLSPALLARVRCPDCASPLTLERALAGPGLDHGVAACRCARFPIVGGVLIVQRESREPILALLDDREGLARHLAEVHQVPAAVLWGEPGTFFAALDEVERLDPAQHDWFLHMRHWHRTPKYLAALPLAGELAARPPRTALDLCSGAGHFGHLALRYAGVQELYAVDDRLCSLLLSRYFFEAAPALLRIHADVRAGLPLADGAVDAVLSADALHYIEPKRPLLDEVRRVRAPGAALIFTHLHNADATREPYQGRSLGEEEWRALFRGALGEIELIADEELRRRWLGRAAFVEAGPSRSFTVRAGLAPAGADFLTAPLVGAIVNPIYSVARAGGTLMLERSRLDDTFQNEFAYPEPPETFQVELARLGDPGYRAELRRRALVIDPPRRMVDDRDLALLP